MGSKTVKLHNHLPRPSICQRGTHMTQGQEAEVDSASRGVSLACGSDKGTVTSMSQHSQSCKFLTVAVHVRRQQHCHGEATAAQPTHRRGPRLCSRSLPNPPAAAACSGCAPCCRSGRPPSGAPGGSDMAHAATTRDTQCIGMFPTLRTHSVSFTGALGGPKYRIGLERGGEGWKGCQATTQGQAS